MPSVSVFKLSRWLEQRFNVKGGVPIQDIDPLVKLAFLFKTGNEDRYLQGWNRFAMAAVVGAVAAQFGAVRLRNPAGSNLVAVIEKANAWGGLADQPNVRQLVTNVDFTAFTPAKLDTRTIANSGLSASTGNAAAQAGTAIAEGQIGTSQNTVDFILTENQEMTILPGDSVSIWNNTVNQGFQAAFTWRERALETSELT